MRPILPLNEFITQQTGLSPDEAIGERAMKLLRDDRLAIADALVQVRDLRYVGPARMRSRTRIALNKVIRALRQ